MRIVGGEFRSRRLKTLRGRAVRPTSDRLRETLFNILREEVVGKVFVDAYAGTGAVGIEALSRGASRAVFVENDPKAAALIRENLRSLGLEPRATIITSSAVTALDRSRGDIVFLDPPYREAAEYDAVLSRLGVRPPSLVIAEHARRLELRPAYTHLERVRVLQQGESSLSFYRAVDPLIQDPYASRTR